MAPKSTMEPLDLFRTSNSKKMRQTDRRKGCHRYESLSRLCRKRFFRRRFKLVLDSHILIKNSPFTEYEKIGKRVPYIENLEEIEQQLDPESILEMIQPGKPIKSTGNELRTCCPVHKGDGAENFCINKDTKLWCCHSNGCEGKGLINLYMKSEDITHLPKAVDELARRFPIEVRYKKDKNYTREDVMQCWETASYNGKDTYFLKKKLKPPTIAKFGKNPNGYYSTLIPYNDVDGNCRYILSISGKGKFQYKISENISGAFATLGQLGDCEFYVGEGIATAQTVSIADNTQIPTVSCGSKNNMFPVVKAIKRKYPRSKPIILVDNDASGDALKEALKVKKEFPETTLRMPLFEGMTVEGDKKPSDFNDLISKCGQPLEVVKRQLQQVYTPEIQEDITTQTEEGDLFSKIGSLYKDPNLPDKLRNRSYRQFEEEHKKLFAGGGLSLGLQPIDSKLFFGKSDFVIVQGMSNHGKSSLMLWMLFKFLLESQNNKHNPMCIYLTYESSPLAVEAKLQNLLSHSFEGETIIKFDGTRDEKFLYPGEKEFFQTKSQYNKLLNEQRLLILRGIPIEKIGNFIEAVKIYHPERTIVLFLDYLQITTGFDNLEGWERIKRISYHLENLAINKEVIIFTGSQVNENRQTREGRDAYNAATTVIDIINHSHTGLLLSESSKKFYKERINNKAICTFSVVKQKHGESFKLDEYFLFNGFTYEEKKTISNMTLNSSQGHVPNRL